MKMIQKIKRPKRQSVSWGKSYYADHNSPLKTRYLFLLFLVKFWLLLIETIQKIKCKLGWHKWHYGYLNESGLGTVVIRVCMYHCWRVETINSAVGNWVVLDLAKLESFWEGL